MVSDPASGALRPGPEFEQRPVWSVTGAQPANARDRIIAAASALFCHGGFTATGIDAVIARAGTARLLGAFDILYDWFADPYFYGCPFLKAASEFDSRHAEVHGSVAFHKRHITDWLKADLAALGVDDVDQATRGFVVLIDGAIVAAQSSGDPAFALNAKQLAKVYIRQHCKG